MRGSVVGGGSPHSATMRWAVMTYGLVAYLLGIRALVYFVGFAGKLPFFKTVDSGLTGEPLAALAIDSGLLLAFAVPHSLLARDGFKRAFARLLPEAATRSTYVLVAALSLSVVMWQWRPIGTVVWQIDSEPWRLAVIVLGVTGWILAATAYYSIGHLELMGLRQTYRFFQGVPQDSPRLVTTGAYRHLRNPMYWGFAIGMWATPTMTVGHLLLSVALSLYVLIGLRYERRDLMARFGDRYRDYLRTGI